VRLISNYCTYKLSVVLVQVCIVDAVSHLTDRNVNYLVVILFLSSISFIKCEEISGLQLDMNVTLCGLCVYAGFIHHGQVELCMPQCTDTQ